MSTDFALETNQILSTPVYEKWHQVRKILYDFTRMSDTAQMDMIIAVSDQSINQSGQCNALFSGKRQVAVKMVNGSRYYRALESVSIASALSSALTIYPCQIRVHQRRQSKLQLSTARKKWWPAIADSSPQAVTCQHCDTHYLSRPRTHNTTFRLLVRRATSSATDSPYAILNCQLE